MVCINIVRRFNKAAYISLFITLVNIITPAQAENNSPQELPWKSIFPEASKISSFEGKPESSKVYEGRKIIGYLFLTNQIAPIPAYSGRPINMLVGIDTKGIIKGIRIIEHHEPILLVGIPESTLDEFVNQYIGNRVDARIKVGAGGQEGFVNVDAITGATVTVMVMNQAILRSAREVAISKKIIPNTRKARRAPARVRTELFSKSDWKELTDSGAVRRLHLTRKQVDNAFVRTEAEKVDQAEPGQGMKTFIDLYYAYLNAPTIGRNLLGDDQYSSLMVDLKPGEHAIAMMANGIYSFKGSGYVRGGIFDRIHIRQANREISFRDLDYTRLSDTYAKNMPKLSEMAIFVIRPNHQFDPGLDWEIELLVKRQTGPLDSVFSSFTGRYAIPEAYVEQSTQMLVEDDLDEPIWRAVWRDRIFQIIILSLGLITVTIIMAMEDILAKRPKLLSRLRTGFLIYTVFFIGWYMLGQLSIVNVFTFTGSVMQEFSWNTFLIDPAMFILWVFVAGTLLLWGRGVYCGWLCPFGAIQKLVNQVAMHYKVVQLNVPQFLHDRLWGIKYLILMVLFGISLESLSSAERYAEIEPFKTAITLRFDRELVFVLYALLLIFISIFNCKFYCKYICPLGAALAVPAKLSLVNWLRRRKECGNPCQTCAKECEIQAINDRGEIQINECHYCMDCQVTYWDEYKCPPLVDRRKKHDRATGKNSKTTE
ncbi:MAG: NosR/NirI family protein [Gammaproteobacteria bacterium]|nr:NosR/NirI family protein [Gammaproteobacteria bacterium]